jgi:hypothetical protein
MMRMLTRLVPWNDANQIRSVAANICPELLMPQAVIDVKNLVILDERVDLVRIPHPCAWTRLHLLPHPSHTHTQPLRALKPTLRYSADA